MSINPNPTFPFICIKDERLYRFNKLFAESYVTNLRNLEAPWKPVVASLLEAVVEKIHEELKLPTPFDIVVQQEQPLAPPALSAASAYADTTMTSSKHKGTVYPDVSVLRYIFKANSDFRAVSHNDMRHKAVDYLVCAELKRSIKRAHIKRGLKITDTSYGLLLAVLRSAAIQAQRQAFLAMKRPDVVNSDVILIAASGPFWMWCVARRAKLFSLFSNRVVENVLDEAEGQRDQDNEQELAIILEDSDDEDGDNTTISSALSTMSAQAVFKKKPELPWTGVAMLDTKESEKELRSVVDSLITIVQKKKVAAVFE